MKAFLLTERCNCPWGEGMLIVASNEIEARKLATKAAPRFFAPARRILWESEETVCIELGECPFNMPKEVMTQAAILLACLVENGNLYLLNLEPKKPTLEPALSKVL